ncbi:MAG: hypothetical protein M3461_12790 [Pseudomonadota bacterium]|nr:hypothetical protein [Pseudomonadota bacterium]
MAEEFAGDAGWSAEARLAGLVHDLGKYGDLFQRLLELLGDESAASVLRSITQRIIHDDLKGSKP